MTVGATLAGIGFTHQISGIQYRTFTEPLPRVSRATQVAFKRMAIKLEKIEPTKQGALLRATTSDRNFEVALESLTPSTTRMRAIARNQFGIIVDSSTSAELIRQAEKVLEPVAAKKRS